MDKFKTKKAILLIFVLFLFIGLFAVGCKKASKYSWINTSSLPGHTFSKHTKNSTKQANSGIIYLGASESQEVNFGPKDVSFEFRDLK